MENLPPEINGLIFSYLDTKEILDYMKSSDECCAEIKKFSKYIAIDFLEIQDSDNILYFTDMKVGTVCLHGNKITDNDLKLISECIKRIKHIDLFSCEQISDDGLKYFRNIQTIQIDHCDRITDNGLLHLQNIARIAIYNNPNITNNGIKTLKNVRYLQFGELEKITDDCFEYLGNVEVLHISDNSLTDDALKYLSNINFLKVEYCRNITIEGINKLLEKRPKLIWSLNDVGNNGSDKMHFFA
jgi:hypothetical protein